MNKNRRRSKPYSRLVTGPFPLDFSRANFQQRPELARGAPQRRLLDAYSATAQTLPRVKRADTAFRNAPHLFLGLAFYFADVLDFHRRVYRYVLREGLESPQSALYYVF